jgi:hypothetical protein
MRLPWFCGRTGTFKRLKSEASGFSFSKLRISTGIPSRTSSPPRLRRKVVEPPRPKLPVTKARHGAAGAEDSGNTGREYYKSAMKRKPEGISPCGGPEFLRSSSTLPREMPCYTCVIA